MIQQQQMNSLEQVFRSADKDRSGSITAKELMTVKWAHNATFTAKTCELLAAIFDTDKNGTVDFREFAQLFQFVQSMHASFMMYDADRSGKLNAREIAQALAHSGFSFQQSTVDNILKKFAKQTYRVGFQMDFEGFIQLCAFIGQLRTLFQMYDRNNSGTISLNMEQLVNVASAF
ncbi:Penta-EF hand domain-containing protein 1 [Balamuthia mandrillaris]